MAIDAAIHDTSLISIIAIGFTAAFICGMIAARLRLSPIVGYLVAGVIIGPYTPGFVGDQHLASQLSELGIILLMFGVGLHFSLADLKVVKRIAIPGAIGQILAAIGLGTAAGMFMGWPVLGSVILGLALSVASTVVLIRALEERGELQSTNGKIAIGWLIVEDLVVVLALVMLPALAVLNIPGKEADLGELGRNLLLACAKVILFAALMLIVGKRLLPRLLEIVANTKSRELFTLSIFAVSIGVAFGAAQLFGISFALGAFFAGMMIRESDLSNEVAEKALPLQDAFAVLFFVAVGMLFDPNVFYAYPLELLLIVSIIIFGKSIIAFLIVLLFKYPLDTALTVSASLAQIGEFSFILAALGLTYGLLPEEAYSLILAAALVSITLNPLVFKAIGPVIRWCSKNKLFSRFTNISSEHRRKNFVILVGHGKVGRHIIKHMKEKKFELVVVDKNRERVSELQEMGIHAVNGDATYPDLLRALSAEKAKAIIIAIPIPYEARQVVSAARSVNPNIPIIVRAVNDEEYEYFTKLDVSLVVMGERETARKMADFVTG